MQCIITSRISDRGDKISPIRVYLSVSAFFTKPFHVQAQNLVEGLTLTTLVLLSYVSDAVIPAPVFFQKIYFDLPGSPCLS